MTASLPKSGAALREVSLQRESAGIMTALGCGALAAGAGVAIILFARTKGVLVAPPYVPILMVLLGVFFLGAGLIKLVLRARFGPALARVEPEQPRAGEAFEFIFVQPLRGPVCVESIGVYWAFRERQAVNDPDSDVRIADGDRLLGWQDFPGRDKGGAETVELTATFQVPDCPPHRRPGRSTIESMWVVKVRLQSPRGRVVWREYRVPVRETFAPGATPQGFDVVLRVKPAVNAAKLELMGKMAGALPFITYYQARMLLQEPMIAAEGLEETQARALCERITESGFLAVVLPSGEVWRETPGVKSSTG